MYRKWCNLLFRLSLDFLLNFKMAAILNFENVNKQTIRKKSDIDSKHIKITPLKFASIYFFISFRYIKKSNTHRLFLKCRTCKTAVFLNENSNRYQKFYFRYFLLLISFYLKALLGWPHG